MRELQAVTNPATVYSRRRRYWQESRGAVPVGKIVDVNCGDPMCFEREHLILRDKIDNHAHLGWRDYRAIRAQVQALHEGEWLDLPEESNDKKSLVKFRAGLGVSASRIHFLVRSLPTGGVRIIRYGDYYDPITTFHAAFPVLDIPHAIPAWKRPIHFFFGFMRNRSEDQVFSRPIKCSIKSCPHPVFRGAGEYCYQHNHWFDYPMSMTDNAIDVTTFWSPQNPHAGFELVNTVRESPTYSLERSLAFVGPQGYIDARHKSTVEKEPIPAVQKQGTRLRMRLGGGSHSSSKTTSGKARAASRGKGSRHSTKEKRWSRETIEALERQADELLGLDSPEVTTLAEIMREEQANSLMMWGRDPIRSISRGDEL